MRTLQQSTAYELMVFMVDSTDHVTGKAGLTLTINASKAGGAFAAITPTVTERGNGWYALSLTTAHTNTLGDLALRITGTGADPTDVAMQVQLHSLSSVVAGIFTHDLSSLTGEATRSLLNAVRFIRNKWTLTGSTLSVKKEDDATEAWSATVTPTAGASPITGVDPS